MHYSLVGGFGRPWYDFDPRSVAVDMFSSYLADWRDSVHGDGEWAERSAERLQLWRDTSWVVSASTWCDGMERRMLAESGPVSPLSEADLAEDATPDDQLIDIALAVSRARRSAEVRAAIARGEAVSFTAYPVSHQWDDARHLRCGVVRFAGHGVRGMAGLRRAAVSAYADVIGEPDADEVSGAEAQAWAAARFSEQSNGLTYTVRVCERRGGRPPEANSEEEDALVAQAVERARGVLVAVCGGASIGYNNMQGESVLRLVANAARSVVRGELSCIRVGREGSPVVYVETSSAARPDGFNGRASTLYDLCELARGAEADEVHACDDAGLVWGSSKEVAEAAAQQGARLRLWWD